jgi:hypothetical protein
MRRPVHLVAATALVPVGAAWALGPLVMGPHAGPSACPFRDLTGVPCPMCGATRAFVYFLHGDGRFVHYNWAWLVLWAAVLAWGVTAVLRTRSGRAPPLAAMGSVVAVVRARPWLLVGLPLLLLPFWAVALANAGPILGY